MAATCEISNVFSNYFSAMYSSEDPTLASVPPAAAFGTDDLVLTLSNPQMPLEGPGGSQEAGLGRLGAGETCSNSLLDKWGVGRGVGSPKQNPVRGVG